MAGRPRALVITPDYAPDPGGIQLLVHRLATTLSALEVSVVAPGDEAAVRFDRSSSIRVHRVRQLWGGRRATIAALNAEALRLARRWRPDVVLCAHVVASPAAAAIRRQFGAPVAQYLHAAEAATRPKLAAFALARADATIAVSRHTRDLGLRVGANPATMHVISPGVDLTPRTARRRLAQPTILTVARLEDRYKGHDTIIHGLPLVRARVPDVQWVVVGDGRLRRPLEALAATYGVADAVRFVGRLSDEERDGWLETAHVFAMPSRVPGAGIGGEGFGIAFLEANWHELPVVAGKSGGALDAVAHRESGILADPDDAVAIADALTTLLLDRHLAQRLGRQGAERARRFAWPMITARVEELLLDLIGAR